MLGKTFRYRSWRKLAYQKKSFDANWRTKKSCDASWRTQKSFDASWPTKKLNNASWRTKKICDASWGTKNVVTDAGAPKHFFRHRTIVLNFEDYLFLKQKNPQTTFQ